MSAKDLYSWSRRDDDDHDNEWRQWRGYPRIKFKNKLHFLSIIYTASPLDSSTPRLSSASSHAPLVSCSLVFCPLVRSSIRLSLVSYPHRLTPSSPASLLDNQSLSAYPLYLVPIVSCSSRLLHACLSSSRPYFVEWNKNHPLYRSVLFKKIRQERILLV